MDLFNEVLGGETMLDSCDKKEKSELKDVSSDRVSRLSLSVKFVADSYSLSRLVISIRLQIVSIGKLRGVYNFVASSISKYQPT